MDLNKNIRTIEVSVFKTKDIEAKFVFVKLPGLTDEDCVTFLRKLGVGAESSDLMRYDKRAIEWLPLDVTIFFLSDADSVKNCVSQIKEEAILNKFLVVPVESEIDEDSSDLFVGYSRTDSFYINIESYTVELYSVGTKPEHISRCANEDEVLTLLSKFQKKMLKVFDEFKEEVASRFR